MESHEVTARFRNAELIKDTTPDGRWSYRLLHYGKLVARDLSCRYLREIMYQLDATPRSDLDPIGGMYA